MNTKPIHTMTVDELRDEVRETYPEVFCSRRDDDPFYVCPDEGDVPHIGQSDASLRNAYRDALGRIRRKKAVTA